MAETAVKVTPLGHLPRTDDGSAQIRLAECPLRGRINLRGDTADAAFLAAVSGAAGIEPPTEANTGRRGPDTSILWLGPDEWLVETTADAEAATASALEQALSSLHAAATVVGDAVTTLSVSGPRAPDLLAKGMTLDLDPKRFLPGACARSLLGKVTVTLHRPTEEIAYEITVGRSFADYAWRWLHDAALEYAGPGAGD